jgi:hypothetical protein
MEHQYFVPHSEAKDCDQGIGNGLRSTLEEPLGPKGLRITPNLWVRQHESGSKLGVPLEPEARQQTQGFD